MQRSIKQQLLTAFAIHLVLMLVLGVFAVAQMRTMNEKASLVEHQTIPLLDTISSVEAVISQYRALQLEFLINTSSADQDRLLAEMQRLEAEMQTLFRTYDELLEDSAEPDAFAQVQSAWLAFSEANHTRFIPLARQGNTGTVQPVFNRLNPLYHELIQASQSLNQANHRQASEALGVVQSSYHSSQYVLLICTALALTIAGMVGFGFANRIAKRIRRLTQATQDVAHGLLDLRIYDNNSDEIGSLARHFNQMTASLSEQRVALEQRHSELQYSLERQQQLTDDLIRGKQAEEQAYRAQAVAEAASQAKSMFVATMSHELRTPLTAILGYTQLMWLNPQLREFADVRQNLERVQAAGKHLLTIINNILDFSKIEQGKMELHLKSFEISQLARDVIAIVEPLAKDQENTLILDVPSDLPMMISDAGKLRQVLFNLLSNACKFTAQGTISLRVSEARVSELRELAPQSEASGTILRFEVSDTGIGIPEDKLNKLFQAFSQVDASVTRRYDGTGLGLVLSKELCRLMGGAIAVRSEYGKGSTFTVLLPLNCPQSEDTTLDKHVGVLN